MEYFIETVFGLGMFINAILFIPQVIRLLKTHNSNDLSLLTFGGFNFIQIFCILHGYLHQDYIFMFGMALSLLTSGTVTLLIIIFRIQRRFRQPTQPGSGVQE